MDPLEQQQLTQAQSAFGTFWHRCRSELVTELLRAANVRTVLDIGAGAGHLGAWIQFHAPEIRYCFRESSPLLAAVLDERFSAEQNMNDGDSLDDVDAAVMLDVIEHIDDDHGFVEDLVGRLPKGGLLIATVPAMPSLFSGWDDAMGHHRRYTRRSLTAVVDGLPVWVAECSYLFPELLPAAALRRIARPTNTDVSPEFPDFPPALDALLFRTCRISSRVRRAVPMGTSLLMVATKTSAAR